MNSRVLKETLNVVKKAGLKGPRQEIEAVKGEVHNFHEKLVSKQFLKVVVDDFNKTKFKPISLNQAGKLKPSSKQYILSVLSDKSLV